MGWQFGCEGRGSRRKASAQLSMEAALTAQPARSPLAIHWPVPVLARWCVVLRHPSFVGVEWDTVGPAGRAPLHRLQTERGLPPAGSGQPPDPRALCNHTASGCERHLSAHQVRKERDSQLLPSE